MAICKCKMCGGDLNITELDKVVECEYCGTTQTVPSANNEKKMTLFNRANRLRSNNEFDKAAALYEQLVAEFPEEAEAYWGLCLCNYGIEYVDDPATGKKIPTCHRASFEKLSADENFNLAMEYADVIAQRQYRAEAREIDRINEEILSVSRNETPYDIFICYKETDENGGRTPDSVMAQDIYDALTAKGYKVFFSRISLEDKLGQQYEPYIFAALNSAKIMLSVGTKYEYFHAVWVKNEWSRFLRLAAKDKSKTLIPCYKNMDPYDMPDEFQALQGQDLGKLGAIQDLVRGIEKLLQKDAPAQPASPAQVVVTNPATATIESLLKRAFMFLEDNNWQSADEYAEKVLDIDPEAGEAYLVKAMANAKIAKRENIVNVKYDESFWESKTIKKAMRYGTEALKVELQSQKDAVLTEQEKTEKEREDLILNLARKRAEIADVKYRINVFNDSIYGIQADGTYVSNKPIKEKHRYTGKKLKMLFDCFGIKTDGTIDAPDNDREEYHVLGWTDIVKLCPANGFTLGLKSDGTVVSTNSKSNIYSNATEVFGWNNIVDIAAGSTFSVGVKRDGTVICTKGAPSGIRNWTDIVEVAAHEECVIGLKKDGTVVAFNDIIYYGNHNDYIDQVSEWRNIIHVITDGFGFFAGLTAEGTVVTTQTIRYIDDETEPELYYPFPEVSEWMDIVSIFYGYSTFCGLKADGTVLLAIDRNDEDAPPMPDLSSFKLFNDYRTIEEERLIAEKHSKEEQLTTEKIAKEDYVEAFKRAAINRQTNNREIPLQFYHREVIAEGETYEIAVQNANKKIMEFVLDAGAVLHFETIQEPKKTLFGKKPAIVKVSTDKALK